MTLELTIDELLALQTALADAIVLNDIKLTQTAARQDVAHHVSFLLCGKRYDGILEKVKALISGSEVSAD